MNIVKKRPFYLPLKFESNYTFCKLSDPGSIVKNILVRSEAVSDDL